MKINHSSPPIRPGQTPSRDDTREVGGHARPSSPESDPATRTHLGQRQADAGQDIDAARVAEIREAIREGKLEIRAERIADGLIANVQDLLDKRGS